MKKLFDKLKAWASNRSSRLSFKDVSISGELMLLLNRYWTIARKCFWNLVQIVFNARAFINGLREAGAKL